jgi:hypothetical protein
MHANDFVPAALSRGDAYGRSRNPQDLGEQRNARFVRAAINGRRRQRNLQRIPEFTNNGIPPRARLDLYRERHPFAGFMNRNHVLYDKSQRPKEACAGPIAQRLEQQTHNLLVLGSNPSGPTRPHTVCISSNYRCRVDTFDTNQR